MSRPVEHLSRTQRDLQRLDGRRGPPSNRAVTWGEIDALMAELAVRSSASGGRYIESLGADLGAIPGEIDVGIIVSPVIEAPTGLTISSTVNEVTGISFIYVDWNDVDGASGYELGFIIDAGGEFIVPAPSSFFQNSVISGQTISIRVRSINALNVPGPWSSYVNHVAQTDTTPPPVPTGLEITPAFNGFWIEWDPSPAADIARYDILESELPTPAPTATTNPSFTSASAVFFRGSLPNGAARSYRIRAVDYSENASAWTAPITATTVVDPGELLDLLQGQITESQLFADLGSRIDLIDGPAAMLGSVSQRLAAEALARANSIAAEALARADSIAAEAQTRADSIAAEALARGTAITNERTLRQSADENLAQQITTISAVVDFNTAAIQTEQTTRATADSAIATDVTALDSRLTTTEGNVTANASAVSSLDTRVTSAEGAITSTSSDVTALQNVVNNPSTGVTANASAVSSLDTRVTSAEGAITSTSSDVTALQNVVNNPSTGVTANASAVSSLDTRVTSAEGAITSTSSDVTALQNVVNNPSTGVTANAAGVTALSTAVGDLGSDVVAVSGRTTALEATVNNPTTGVTATAGALDTLETVINDSVSGLSATATKVNNLQATINDPVTGLAQTYAALQQESEVRAEQTGDLFAQYTVKIDLNGYVSGFGLSSEAPVDGTPSSEFVVRADSFSVAGTGAEPEIPFIVRTSGTTIGGQYVPPGVYIRDGFIQNGTITNATIANATISDAKIANLSAAKLTAGTAIANNITVNGQSLGTVQSNANNPAARINAASTNILPGKITLTGSATLLNWTASADRTRIDGGRIFTNSIDADAINTTSLTADSGFITNLTSTGTSFMNQLLVRTANIDDAAITSAKIDDAAVDTLQIAGNAVIVPLFAEGLLKTGGTGFQDLAVGTLTLSTPAPLVILWSIEHGYSTFPGVDWDYRLVLDGVVIAARFGMSFGNDFPSSVYYMPSQSAGQHEVKLQWRGATSEIDARGRIVVLGVQR